MARRLGVKELSIRLAIRADFFDEDKGGSNKRKAKDGIHCEPLNREPSVEPFSNKKRDDRGHQDSPGNIRHRSKCEAIIGS